jgi:Transposase family tnp2
MKTRLQRRTGIKPHFFDCCYNSCVAFTGKYANDDKCPYCKEMRFTTSSDARKRSDARKQSHARKQVMYVPLIDRLKYQYRNAFRARVLSNYRHSFTEEDSRAKWGDFFDGDLYHGFHQIELGLFQDRRDIALQMSLDGVQLTNLGHHEVTPVILINLNLPPEERVKVDNILASMIIPGPQKPKDLDTFLQPLVEELKLLDRGVEAYDANTGSTFNLKAWVTMVTGNSPPGQQ